MIRFVPVTGAPPPTTAAQGNRADHGGFSFLGADGPEPQAEEDSFSFVKDQMKARTLAKK